MQFSRSVSAVKKIRPLLTGVLTSLGALGDTQMVQKFYAIN